MALDGLHLGIDLGSSTIFVTQWNSGKKIAEPIVGITKAGFGGPAYFDNFIYYETIDNHVLGKTARKMGTLDPLNAVEGVKRKLEINGWKVKIPSINQELSAEDICSDIFKVIKNRCSEIFGGKEISGVVISVPFAFLSNQRQKIKNAAERSGLKVLKLIEEPVAAAISYGLLSDKNSWNENEKILVFDFGGGTFDVTIFKLSSGDDHRTQIEVLNTGGHSKLGGMDIDFMLFKKFQKEMDIDLALISDKIVQGNITYELLKEAREVKEKLSDPDEESVDAFWMNYHSGKHLEMDIELEDFEKWLFMDDGFMGKIEEVLIDTLDFIELEPEDIDKIILVGGSSKIPAVQNVIKDVFGKQAESVRNPLEMVGKGAGIYCGSLIEEELNCEIITKLSHSIGIKAGQEFKPLIEKNSVYESFSEIEFFNITRRTKNPIVEVYQGNTTDINECSPVGRIELDATDTGVSKLGIQLGTDQNGIVIYKIFQNRDSEPLVQGIVET